MTLLYKVFVAAYDIKQRIQDDDGESVLMQIRQFRLLHGSVFINHTIRKAVSRLV